MINNNELVNILKSCEREANDLNHPFIGTEHFILSALKCNCEIKNILNDEGVFYDNYKNELLKIVTTSNNVDNLIYTPLLKRILYACSDHFDSKSVFIKILEEGEGIGISILNNLNIDVCDLYSSVNTKSNIYGIDLTDLSKNNKLEKVIGRNKEIKELIEVLCRKNKCNPLLLGEAGVGKTAIVEGLAKRIVNREVPKCLYNYKIISISMSSLVSGTKYRGEFEEKVEKLIKKYSSKPNIILFIDEIHTIVGAGGAEGAIDASNILKPFLARNTIKCIGSTTLVEYNKSIKKDKALDRRFNKIIVKEPSETELREILYGIKNDYEKFHNVKITNKELDYILKLSKNNTMKKEPDKSIDILDLVCAKASIYLRSEGIDILNKELLSVLKEKNKYLSQNNYKEARMYKKEEVALQNKINNYKPRINNKYIDSILTKYNQETIGFVSI